MRLFPKEKKDWSIYIVVLASALLSNVVLYNLAKVITSKCYHHPIDTAFDRAIPTVPWTVLIYFGCFAFWAVNYCIIANQDPEERDRFFCADFFAKVICFIIFVIFPTTADIREPISSDPTFLNFLMRFLYWIDTPANLFPSIHCLASWFCWIGVRKRKDVPFIYKCFSLIMALAVCTAVLTTRQHVIIDVISGVLLAELCYFIFGFKKLRSPYSKSIIVISNKLKKK